jgi:hypothetical protein
MTDITDPDPAFLDDLLGPRDDSRIVAVTRDILDTIDRHAARTDEVITAITNALVAADRRHRGELVGPSPHDRRLRAYYEDLLTREPEIGSADDAA